MQVPAFKVSVLHAVKSEVALVEGRVLESFDVLVPIRRGGVPHLGGP